MKNKEKLVIIGYLKYGLSFRELDRLLGYDKLKTKGWKSFEILKNCNLKSKDKGKLFLYSNSQCLDFIKKTKDLDIDELIKLNKPKLVEKYSDSKILVKDEEAFYQVMSGETRNLIQSFFSSLKKIVKICQFNDCNNTHLETVHLDKNRPEIFKDCAKNLGVKRFDYFEYPIIDVMIKFLEAHKNKRAICFLCKKHHIKLHELEKLNKLDKLNNKNLNDFKKNIVVLR